MDNQRDMNPDPENPGYIHVDFVALGSAMFNFRTDNVSPIQMIAVGEYMITMGKSALLQEQAKVQAEAIKTQIAIPHPNIQNLDPTKLK